MGPLRELPRSRAALAWFGALGSAAAWGLHLTVTYWYAEGACHNETGLSSLEGVIVVLTLVLGAISLASGLAAWSTWREVRSGAESDPRGRLLLLAMAGLIGAVLFSFAIVLEGVGVLALDACAQS